MFGALLIHSATSPSFPYEDLEDVACCPLSATTRAGLALHSLVLLCSSICMLDLTFHGRQAAPYTAGGRTLAFDDPCDYFRVGKAKASTLSLSVLVAIEMFNALNALSEARTSLLPAQHAVFFHA